MSTSEGPIIFAVRMADTPIRYQSSFELKQIVANAVNLSEERRQQLLVEGCLFDDQCDSHISHLNPWWGELTAIYYLIQKIKSGAIDSRFVGNAQYRRGWIDSDLNNIDSQSIYLTHPCFFPFSLSNQFNGGHHFPGVEMTMHLASKGKLPLTENELACAWTQNRFQGGPMAIGSPEHYVLVMEILFDCLWPIWGEYKEEIMQLNGYDRRAMAFMSERLLSGIVLFSEKFFGNIPLRFIPLQYYGP